MKYAAIAQDLAETGLSISPLFFSTHQLSELRKDLQLLKAAGSFESAGVGRGTEKGVHESVRKNQQCWIDRLHPTETQNLLWDQIDLLKEAFNRDLYLGINGFEGHYTTYLEGGFYQRHLDSFSSNPSRVVSLILYLNEAWSSQDAGELRVYHDQSFTDVAPIGGTLVCFMSAEKEHEVLCNHAKRYSFTGWFKNNRPE